MKRQITAHATLAALVLAPGQAQALGFGRVVSDTVLGQPLSFTVPVRIEAGDRFGEDCVHTLVFFGDAQLPPNQVTTAVERGASDTDWRVRVTTAGPVNEPVVDVALEVGCGRPFSRRFTVFADPPAVPWSAQLAQAQAVQDEAAPAAPARAATPPSSGFSPVAAGQGAAPVERASSGALHPVVRKGPTVALAQAVAARKTAPRHRGPLAPPAPAPARTVAAIAPPLQATEASPRLELSAGFGGPRLRMDIDDPEIPPQDAAATAALSQQVEGDTQQLENLQRNIAGLRRESQSGHAQTARLQAELDAAESRSQWLPWLAGLFGLTLAASLILAWRLRQQSRLAHRHWYEESQLAAAAERDEPAGPVHSAPPVARVAAAHAPAAVAAIESEAEPAGEEPGGAVVHDMAITASVDVDALAEAKAMAPASSAAVASASDPKVSVEDLLDIEQQADFFVALGQEDAAIDLLTAHVRATGVQSPLPYAKLLELHRRLDDTEAYERVRERFERRFGAAAPDWATGPVAGRTLEGYPDAITRLQIVWRAAADAMVLLESMLFKRDPADELLDLPAYRDLLLLYSVARDLVQHGAVPEPGDVDLLLPIGDLASAMAAAAAAAVHEGRHDVDTGDVVPPTTFDAPDLAPEGRSSEFGEVNATLELTPLDFDISEPGEFQDDSDGPSGAQVRH